MIASEHDGNGDVRDNDVIVDMCRHLIVESSLRAWCAPQQSYMAEPRDGTAAATTGATTTGEMVAAAVMAS